MNKPIAIQFTANADDRGTPLVHFWSTCVGAGRANEGLRAGWLEQLAQVKQHCGFRYCRFHGLLHDDMFVYRVDDQQRVVLNFQYIDELFDRMLSIGVRPFVEFGFSPTPLATKLGTVFWWKGNGSPPNDLDQWSNLIEQLVKHWIDRYGLGEVRQWYFEVWNEPNLRPFFTGTRSQYFELYRATVKAVKAVDSSLRVGGPATSNFVPDARFDGETEDTSAHFTLAGKADLDDLNWRPVWLTAFLDFCHREQLPVDFVSTHPYPTDWALDAQAQSVKTTRNVDATPDDLALLRRMVSQSAFPQAEIHLTEWSSSPSPRDHTHDYPQAATYIVRSNLRSIGLVDSLSYWTFTDVFEEGGAGDTAFHGGFGMINYRGIVKPAFHAYRFLHSLGDELLHASDSGCVTRTRETGELAVLAYHYPPEVRQSVPASFDSTDVAEKTLAMGAAAEVHIELAGLMPNQNLLLEVLDADHGNAVAAWKSAGSPASPTREQIASLSAAASNTLQSTVAADARGCLHYRTTLQPWALLLLRTV